MIKLLINQQALSIVTPVIVAGTDEYLTLSASFTPDWEGLSKYIHFIMGTQHLTFALTDNLIREDARMNLTRGTWEVYVVGTQYDENETLTQRITTETQLLEVQIEGVYGREPDTPHDPYSPRTDGDDYLLRSDLHEVAFSGDYNDLRNLPEINVYTFQIRTVSKTVAGLAAETYSSTQLINLDYIDGYTPAGIIQFSAGTGYHSISNLYIDGRNLCWVFRNNSNLDLSGQTYTHAFMVLYIKDET